MGPIMVLGSGCVERGGQAMGLVALESADPAVRVQAIKWAGEQESQESLPLLVDRLMEQDASIRFFAIMALERLTGETLGYDYAGSASSRREAVGRWREWLERRGSRDQE